MAVTSIRTRLRFIVSSKTTDGSKLKHKSRQDGKREGRPDERGTALVLLWLVNVWRPRPERPADVCVYVIYMFGNRISAGRAAKTSGIN